MEARQMFQQQQQFSLRWSNHGDNLGACLSGMKATGRFSDVRLITTDCSSSSSSSSSSSNSIRCHRVILAAGSQ